MTQKEIALHAAWHHLLQSNPPPDVVVAFWESQSTKNLDWFWQPETKAGNRKALTLLDTFWMAVSPALDAGRGLPSKSQSTWSNVWDIVEPQLHITQDVGEEILGELALLSRDDALVLHVVNRMPSNVWRDMGPTKKCELSRVAVKNGHESLLKKFLENGQDPNEAVACSSDANGWRGKDVEGPLLADARSSKIAACLLEHGASPEAKMQNGTTVLAFLKAKDAKLFEGERERKLTWDVVEKAAMASSTSPDYKKKVCLESLQTATTPAEIRFALKKLEKDEWRSWSMEGGGTLVHYLAFVQPLLFDVAFRALKASEEDLRAQDEKGADPYAYFLCSGIEPPQWKEKDKAEWEKDLEWFAKSKTTVDLASKEGVVAFSERALHILQHMPKSKNNLTPLSWVPKRDDMLEQSLLVSNLIRQGIVPVTKEQVEPDARAQKRVLIEKWRQASLHLLNRLSFDQEDQWREVAQKHGVSSWLTSGWLPAEDALQSSRSSVESLSPSAKNVLKERKQLRGLEEWDAACNRRQYNKDTAQQDDIELRAKKSWANTVEGITLERWVKIQALVEKNALGKSHFGGVKAASVVWAEAKNIVERQLLINKTSAAASASVAPLNAL